jgi:adenosine deaminase
MRTELHRHLDVSLRAETIAELSQLYGTAPAFADAVAVRAELWITSQKTSLAEVLDRFVLFPQLLRSTEVLERVAREAVEDAHAEGIDWVEFRYAPAFTSAVSAIPREAALAAYRRGIEAGCRSTGIRAGLICIVSRRFALDIAEEVMEFAIANRDSFVGVDLAGPEDGYPCRNYERIFRRAHAANLPVTIHAGEAAGAENIWEAIDLLGARRIGHGLRAAGDAALMRRMARDGILIETCPTSNFITRGITEWKAHPLPTFLEHGVPVSVSTDDPSIFGVTMDDEYERCRDLIGLSADDLRQIDGHARDNSFLAARDTIQ